MNKTFYTILVWLLAFLLGANISALPIKPNSKPDSLYRSRLEALPFECKMFYNSSVKKYIELYTLRSQRGTERILGLGNFYFPIIGKIFQDYGVPPEMKYIAIIESSLNPGAVSKGVAGMWQFTKGTGQKFGLTINTVVDERRSIVESTVAVALYLKLLNEMYHDWRLVLAAYNCGSGRLNLAIRQAGGSHDFWKIYPHLPAHTRNFVPAFMGIAYAFNYYPEYGLTPLPCHLPAAIDSIRVTKHLHLKQVASVLNINIDTLRRINRQYLRDLIPASENKPFALYIPLEQKANFFQLQDSVFAFKIPVQSISVDKSVSTTGSGKIIHTVRSGESLYAIARQNKVTVTRLKEWNSLKSDRIKPGQKLTIYRKKA